MGYEHTLVELINSKPNFTTSFTSGRGRDKALSHYKHVIAVLLLKVCMFSENFKQIGF